MVEQKTSNENFLGLVWQMMLRAGQQSFRVLLSCPERTPCIYHCHLSSPYHLPRKAVAR